MNKNMRWWTDLIMDVSMFKYQNDEMIFQILWEPNIITHFIFTKYCLPFLNEDHYIIVDCSESPLESLDVFGGHSFNIDEIITLFDKKYNSYQSYSPDHDGLIKKSFHSFGKLQAFFGFLKVSENQFF